MRRTKKPSPKRPGPVPREDWHPVFIREMERFPNVTAACRICKISPSTAKRHREQFPEFRETWDDAKEKAADLLEQAMYERATKGTLKPVFQGGKLVGHVREYSDSIAITMLKALKRETYGDKVIAAVETKPLSDEEALRLGALASDGLVSTIRASLGYKSTTGAGNP
jgi:hypothetical protein